jgi:DNA-binding response OmpR family regulator
VSEQAVKKRVLIVSDTDDLSRTIASSLNGSVDAVRLVLYSLQADQERVYQDHFDLIVLGVSLPDSEPAAMLYQGTLGERIDQIPVVIVSPRTFFSDPEERIFYFDLPLDEDQFHARVVQILQG